MRKRTARPSFEICDREEAPSGVAPDFGRTTITASAPSSQAVSNKMRSHSIGVPGEHVEEINDSSSYGGVGVLPLAISATECPHGFCELLICR